MSELDKIENKNWDLWLKTNEPLVLWFRNSYGLSHAEIEFKNIELYGNSTKIEHPNPKIVFSIKYPQEKFLKFDILKEMGCGVGHLFHERALEKLTRICPNDFQAFNVSIVNSEKSKHKFENKDYYALNIFHRIKALDVEKSKIDHWNNHGSIVAEVEEGIFKNDAWNVHFLVKDSISYDIIWHPHLAYELRNSRGIKFIAASDSYRVLFDPEIVGQL